MLAREAVVNSILDATQYLLVVAHAQVVELLAEMSFDQQLIMVMPLGV